MNANGISPSASRAIEVAIRLGLVLLLIAWCLYIISPFLGLVAWGAIIAIAVHPLYLKLLNKAGGNRKLALTLMAIIALAAVLVPAVTMFSSLVDGASTLGHALKSGTMSIPAPAESVRLWPLIGEKAYAFWSQASADLSSILATYNDQLVVFGKRLASMAAGAGLGVLQFVISILIAIAFLARAEPASTAVKHLARRLSGEYGERLVELSTATVRSVANGLLGIAFFQAMLGGIGMMAVGVPAAGFLAFGILIVAIVQLPPLLILAPVAVYVFSVKTMTVAIVFTIWSVLVSFSDAILKPILLGRGVDAPMLVILLGAIGGMIVSGIIGLFVGAVVLALGYNLFVAWLESSHAGTETTEKSG